MANVFKQIKKQNGEKFARYLRDADNAIFTLPNIVDMLKYAGDNAQEIAPYLRTLLVRPSDMQGPSIGWKELLASVGYDAFVADTLKKQNSIKKYFKIGERLCTFRDPHRFENYHIIHCIKQDADKIAHAPKGKEQRQDAYGTSVISIQLLKEGGFISIKNRYNHTVDCPDDTFDSNPDEICPGLSAALKQYFNVDFTPPSAILPEKYQLDKNGYLFHFNYAKDDVYFAPNAWLANGKIVPINQDKEMLLGHIILNQADKKFYLPTALAQLDNEGDSTPLQSMVDELNTAFQGKQVLITRDNMSPAADKKTWLSRITALFGGDSKTQRANNSAVKSIYIDGQPFMKIRADGSEILELNYPGKELPPEAFKVPIRKLNAPNLQKISADVASLITGSLQVPEGTVIEGDLNLCGRALKKLPDFSKCTLHGNFDCSFNMLKGLSGAPRSISGNFDCSHNFLTSLKDLPKGEYRNFSCSYNQIKDLTGCPEEIQGYFDCSDNKLTSLRNGPKKVGVDETRSWRISYNCGDNFLLDLVGAPEEVIGSFYCYRNPDLINLMGAPKKVGKDFNCEQNRLLSLEGAPTEVGNQFVCSDNQFLTSLKGSPQSVKDFVCAGCGIISTEGKPAHITGMFNYDDTPAMDKENALKDPEKGKIHNVLKMAVATGRQQVSATTGTITQTLRHTFNRWMTPSRR